jgi:hypothetical protein
LPGGEPGGAGDLITYCFYYIIYALRAAWFWQGEPRTERQKPFMARAPYYLRLAALVVGAA